MGQVVIVAPSAKWAAEFDLVKVDLAGLLGELALRIDHVGSTSIPRLPAKDVIDVQVTVADDLALADACRALADAGHQVNPDGRDHPAPNEPDAAPEDWQKGFATERPGQRRTNVHLRIVGRTNHRYALLFRDYLRTHPATADAYAAFKYKAAAVLTDDSRTYADLKDPVCDLVYLPAREWAATSGWTTETT